MNDAKRQIEAIVMEQLVAPYRRKDARLQSADDFPGNWFGLEEIGLRIVSTDPLVHRITYRMSVALCDILHVSHGSTCELIEVDGKATALDIQGLDHPVNQLDAIKHELDAAHWSLLLA